jgi:hypothetical protein
VYRGSVARFRKTRPWLVSLSAVRASLDVVEWSGRPRFPYEGAGRGYRGYIGFALAPVLCTAGRKAGRMDLSLCAV